MTPAVMMEVARRLDCIVTLGENAADAAYGYDGLAVHEADEVANDAAIIADCARYVIATLSTANPEFAKTYQRAKEVGAVRAAMIAQKNGGAA